VYEPLLRKARDLKRRSRASRDADDYPKAEALLKQAIDPLSEELSSAVAQLPAGVPAPPDVRELATELADCWGSLGGIWRRQADALRQEWRSAEAKAAYSAAIDAYERGLVLERDDRFRIANSYNLVQRAVVPALAEIESPDDLKPKLREIALSIDRQIETSRVDDPWAYSDRGLVELLAGDEAKANRTWDAMDRLKPQRNVYASGAPVLAALAEARPHDEALRRAAKRFRELSGAN
jgi:tetratricopeptide (TPR) repeat protein